jgi:hypothetical protein
MVFGRFKVLWAWSGPKSRIVERDHVGSGPTENLGAEAAISDGEPDAKVPRIVRGRN